MDKDNLLVLSDMLDAAEQRGAKFARMEAKAAKDECEANGLREEKRILCRTAEQAENRANTLEHLLEKEREKNEALGRTLDNFAKHNALLHGMLEDAGKPAPTFTEWLAAHAEEEAE